MGKQVDAIAVGSVGVGLIFLWSGLKGASVITTIQELVQGKQPMFASAHSIDIAAAQAASNLGASAGAPGTGATSAGPGKPYCASVFGGPSDPGTGSHGYHGDKLNGTMAYAELSMGTALGKLPYKQRARITYKGKSVIAEKLDIGGGGAGCGGHVRAVDLWWETARALGFNGLGVVTFELVN